MIMIAWPLLMEGDYIFIYNFIKTYFKIILNRTIFNSQKYKQCESVYINDHKSCGIHKGI